MVMLRVTTGINTFFLFNLSIEVALFLVFL